MLRTWRSHQKRPVIRAGSLGRREPHDRVGALLGRAQQRVHDALESRQRTLDARRVGPARDASRARRRRSPRAPRPSVRPAPPRRACCARRPSDRRTRPSRDCRSSTSRRRRYMPPEETKITRAGALATRRSRRRRVSRCGPSTLVANVSSNPSVVSWRSSGSTPALCTSTCTGSPPASRRSAQACTEERSDMSTSSQRTSSLPVSPAIQRRASSPRPASRTSRRSEAPRLRETRARRQPEPRAGTGDEADAPGQRGRLGPVLDARAHERADTREAADHAQLERAVDHSGNRSSSAMRTTPLHHRDVIVPRNGMAVRDRCCGVTAPWREPTADACRHNAPR